MKIEIVSRKIRKQLDEVTVYETIGNVTRVITCGNTPQHHAFVRNVIDAAPSLGVSLKVS